VHAALEAAEGLMREEKLTAADIAAVEVGSFADLVECFADRRPATLIDGEFSLPWTMAAILAGLSKGPAWYADATLADQAMHALADRVSIVVDDEAQARHFSDERKTMSVVRITTTEGRRLERRVTVARGGPASPWPEGGVAAKFRDQAVPAIGAEPAARLEEAVLTLDEDSELAAIFALIRGSAA
jgi:2-methylcitrate dehydratase PrpD